MLAKKSKVSMHCKISSKDNQQKWPADGFEYVLNCPVCGADKRKLIHQTLTDNVFFCAPGEWSMYQCESCASAYLDPRPNLATIELAYQNYFTHSKEDDISTISFFRKLRRKLANGYLNFRYGTREYPASIFGILAGTFISSGRATMEAEMRHLPKPKAGMRLLDVGCGNGQFLCRAQSAGWNVVGVDFDSQAVEEARSNGIDIRLGCVESLPPSIEKFDVITMAHVIEHVHQPLEVLKSCYSLLKQGGFLWIETPNIASEGHRLFGENWRGLEPPRHLVLFNVDSLNCALSSAGFTEIQVQPYRPLCEDIFGVSLAISEGMDPYSGVQKKPSSKLVKESEEISKRNPLKREFITFKAWKK